MITTLAAMTTSPAPDDAIIIKVVVVKIDSSLTSLEIENIAPLANEDETAGKKLDVLAPSLVVEVKDPSKER